MSLYGSYADQRRREDYRTSSDERRSTSGSPVRQMEVPSSTLLLRGMTSSVTDRDVRRALDNERGKYTDVRLVRDRGGKMLAFVDFVSLNDSRQFMKECRGELEVRKHIVRMDYSNSREKKEDDRWEEPTPTIMLRGIPSNMDYRDVRDALDDCRVEYLDLRVIRDKHTGATKGFGFVDFASVHEAKRWMEYQKGYFKVRRHELRLSYSTPRGPSDIDAFNPGIRSSLFSEVSTGDWICSRCSSHNFRRRDQCYKCQLPRSQIQSLANSVDGVDLIGTTPCNTLVLRCLDAMTTEDEISKVFEDTADVKVRQCHVMRDEIDHTSRCFAFAELPSVADAYKVMDIVSKEQLFEIGGKAVTLSYAKNTFNTIMATLKTEGSYNAQLNSSRNLALDLAHAAMAAQQNKGNPDAVAFKAVAASALLNQTSASVAIAQAAIQKKQTEQHVISALTKNMRSSTDQQSSSYALSMAGLAAAGQTLPPPTFPFNAATVASTTYPYPDTSKFIYDEATRFYYDPVTGLLYEPNTKYFFDRSSQVYYYWDQTRSTYIQVPQNTTQTVEGTDAQSVADNTEVEAKEKPKSAQQIAKEMEKWAKKMNSQKKSITTAPQRSDYAMNESSRTADTCYAILEAGSQVSDGNLVSQYASGEVCDDTTLEEVPTSRRKTMADLNAEAEGKVADEETQLIDWAKLACLLCSRGFKDAATLQKHRSFSSLHVENLNKLRMKYGLQPLSTPSSGGSTNNDSGSASTMSIASLMQLGAQAAKTVNRQPPGGTGQYRDRARERRAKYGVPSPPRNKYSGSPPLNPPIPAVVETPVFSDNQIPLPPAPSPDSGPNVGSRLMEKMGWQAGQGLGRANQGRTQIIEAEFREAGVGLGVKTYKRGPASDNYKDNVKRAMFARFNDLQ